MFADYKKIKALNETNSKLYHYMIDHIDEVIDMNVRTFADVNYVSAATVVRFCRALGCDGFADLKKQLQSYNDRKISFSDQQDVSELIHFLKHTLDEEFENQINTFVDYLLEKSTIFFIGIGNSGAIARYGARYFSNLGLFSFCVDDPFYPAYLRGSDYCVIVLSESGETIELIDQVSHYKEDGATVLLITNNKESTLMNMADCAVVYGVTETMLVSTYDVTSQVPALYVLEKIAKRAKAVMPEP